MRPLKNAGFTLIEVMIVTAIIAGTIVMALPYITNRNSETRAFLREMTVLSRELHTKAKLHGVAYRMVIDFGTTQADGAVTGQKISVEKANGKVVLNDKEEENALERLKETDAEKKQDPKGFSPDSSVLKREKAIPASMRIDKVELTRVKTPITEGRAFIHYLPQGLVDEAAIHLKGQATQAWTITIHPLTGRAEIIAKPISLKEIKSQ
ncbi:MAG TPA: type II secretion system protein [Bdellovibrionales bacterium]|nr:type II secretion system protein [Bdellovibrionales bacterium]